MLRNYVKIALRTLWKQKGITAINVLGLAAGMAVCLLVGLLIWDQLTHDDFHPGADRLYRTTIEVRNGLNGASTPIGLAPTLRNQMAGVEAATRLQQSGRNVTVENQAYEVQRAYYAEPSFFDVFGFELVAGREETALAAPNTAVVTKDLARRLYGEADPMGKTFHLPEVGTFTVTGVMNRDAYRSHLKFDALYSFATIDATDQPSWARHYTYLRLETGYSPVDVAPTLRQIWEEHPLSELPGDAALAPNAVPEGFRLQALSEIPLGGSFLQDDNARGLLPPVVAYFLAALAGLILLAAGFNYVNLSMARSLTRAREVGVRKTIGAHRGQVVGQFIAEAILAALLALVLAAVFLEALVPAFNQLAVVNRQGIRIGAEPGPLLYGAFLLFAVLVGLVAGLYPAWHLSQFEPSRVLKASAQSRTPGFEWITLRKVLIVLQFALAFVVVVTAVLLHRQVHHVGAAEEVQLETDHLVHVELQDVGYEPFRQKARQIPGIERVAGASEDAPLTGGTPGEVYVRSTRIPDSVRSVLYGIDYEFTEALDLPLVATEEWTEERFEGGQAILINETAARQLGFESSNGALGHPLTIPLSDTTRSARVAGIVQDFYFDFGTDPSRPLLFLYSPEWFEVALARVTPGQEQQVLQRLSETWSQLDSANPVEAYLYNDLITDNLVGLADTGWILSFMAGLAVLIGCLGLLGIATYTVQTRTREVGIRKALGATVTSIVSLLSRDFLWLIGAAVALGLPVAWWVNRFWLQSFAYRIELGVWTFTLSAVGLLALALLAIGSQTLRAARTDPATTLRDE